MSVWIVVLLVFVFVAGLGPILIAMLYDPGGGTYVKEDGTIVEWDGQGGCGVYHPDGSFELYGTMAPSAATSHDRSDQS